MVLIVGSNSDEQLKKIEDHLNEIDDGTLEILKYIAQKQKGTPSVAESEIYGFFNPRKECRKQ